MVSISQDVLMEVLQGIIGVGSRRVGFDVEFPNKYKKRETVNEIQSKLSRIFKYRFQTNAEKLSTYSIRY